MSTTIDSAPSTQQKSAATNRVQGGLLDPKILFP